MKNKSLNFNALFITALIIFTGMDLLRHYHDISSVFTWMNISLNIMFCLFIAVGWKLFEKIRDLYFLFTNYLEKKTEALVKEINK